MKYKKMIFAAKGLLLALLLALAAYLICQLALPVSGQPQYLGATLV